MQINEMRATWQEIWWAMGGGVKSEYDKIKATDVFEYYKLFDLWRERVNRERDNYKHQNQQKNARK